MTLITNLTEAVLAELNATSFSLPLLARRGYRPRYELADLGALHVTLIPSGLSVQPASRGAAQYEVAIDLAVQQKLSGEANADIDPLLALTEEIAEHFRGQRLDSFPNALWVKTEHRTIFATEHLEQYRQFTSLLTLTFRVVE